MVFFLSHWPRTVAISVAAIALSFGTVGEAIALNLKGAGASFPAPLYQKYFAEFKKESGIAVTYDAVGSGKGISSFIANTVDFAGTDAPPVQSQIDQMSKGMVLVPTAGGAVAVVFNLPGISELKLSQSVLANIFQGKITQWNNAKIAKDNPGVKLPALPIKPVVREDSSGTTYIFTRHLSAVSPQFQKNVDVSTQPKWPGNPLKGAQNEGVANQVKQTQGSIGYVQDTYARKNKLATAQLQNLAGDFVAPTLAETYKALSTVRFYQDLRAANLQNPETGYPIVGITWILVKQQYESAEKADGVKKMVSWILGKGQGFNEGLEYTRIPEQVATSIVGAVQSKVTGK
ncbi:MAG: phosphate ABC transporter substrate-binding protein PstS [Microcoleaceae cyanobacterium]